MKKMDKRIYTFTKTWINRLMWLFVIWISLTYVLAFMGRESIVETLSQDVMTGGVVLFAGYMLKAFFETYSEEKNKYKREVAMQEKIAVTGDMEPTGAEGEEET